MPSREYGILLLFVEANFYTLNLKRQPAHQSYIDLRTKAVMVLKRKRIGTKNDAGWLCKSYQ